MIAFNSPSRNRDQYRMKRILLNFFLCLFSVSVVLATGEIIFRVFNIYQPDRPKLLTEYDPLLGWKLKPKAQGQHKTMEYVVNQAINSKGLRGPEISYNKPRGTFRVLLLGDSFVEGYMVDFDKHFSQIMQHDLQKHGIEAEVICGGVRGYSTDQQLLFYENEGKKYHPEITVLMFYDNDIWYNTQPNYWRGFKPFFILRDDKLILSNVPVPKPIINQKPLTIYGKFHNFLINNSVVYNFVNDRLSDNSLNILSGQEMQNSNKQFEDMLLNELKFYQRNYTSDMRYAWNVTRAIILRLNKNVRADNGRLLVCYIPNVFSLYQDQWKDLKKRYQISDHNSDLEQVGKELEVICQKNAIDYFNLIKPLQKEALWYESQGKRLYYSRDPHWNTLGHKVVGKYLANFIKVHYVTRSICTGTDN